MTPINVVRSWLENWEEWACGGGRPEYEVPSNCGPKEYDGVSYRRLRIIEMKQAIKSLPVDQRNVIICRYVRRYTLADTLALLKTGRKQYYRLCDEAVQNVWRYINYGPKSVAGQVETL